jgi:hypothetical protein
MRKNRYAWVLLGLLAATGAIACDDDPDPVDPIVPLTEQVTAALDDAIQDSYRTYYTYTVVLEDMGQAMPFTSIMAAEQAFRETLASLYAAHGATPPASMWNAGNVPRFASMQEACMAAEEGEVATRLMFDRLLGINLPNDIRQSFENMRATARNTHRMAFRQCAGGTVTPLTPLVNEAVAEAIQDEYRAFYTYGRVLDDLGTVAPFVRIRDAEWQHVGALANLYVKRDLTVPTSTWTLDNVPRYNTLQAACAAGVEGEIDNVEMYDRLLLQDVPVDVVRVFENLRAASLENHLPAFESCAGN